MSDPVWFGNYIVPRWMALLIIAGFAAISVAGVVGILAVLIWMIRRVSSH